MILTKTELTLAESRLGDPHWRLNSLYCIVDKSGNKQTFKFNWAQEELYHNKWYCNIILKARQLGISTFICLLFLDRCLFNSNVAAGIICHTREDAEQLFKRIKFAYDALPQDLKVLRPATIDSARELCFNNGSSLRVGTSMRGSTVQYLHISEFGKICAHFPEKAREIITGSLNTLAPGQYCFIESTAEGREGKFFELCKQAQAMKEGNKHHSPVDFKFHFYPWFGCPDYVQDHPALIPDDLEAYFSSLEQKGIDLTLQQKYWYAGKLLTQGEDMKREYPSTPEESFETAVDGAYYSKQLAKARIEERICRVFHEPDLPVHSAWDLGFGDSTAIWFFQVLGKEIRLIEYYENSGEPLTFYLQFLKTKKYNYGTHLVPHDAGVHEYSTGLSRMEVAKNLGVSFTKVTDISIDEGIDAVRKTIDRCWFDEQKCSTGIKHLDAYKRQWNDKHGCWGSKPLHNASSHGADAFRMLCVGMSQVTRTGLTAEDLDKMHKEVMGVTSHGKFFDDPIYPNHAMPYGFSG